MGVDAAAGGIEAALKAYAREIGADLVGIAPATPFPELEATLRARAETGLYPPFAERDIERRVDPERWLPGARALISVGLGYLVEGEDQAEEPPEPYGLAPPAGPRGRISRYCSGEDYHRLLHARLALLTAWLDRQAPGHRHVAFVDTGPAADREVAVRAGLGWFGRHTNVITPGLGSWVFWGEIATTVPLAPDPPHGGTCGGCTRCVDACPTGAILDLAGTLDPHRCLSYVTQAHGAVPPELRQPLGPWIFGCDICQEVCPYNHAARPAGHPEFRPRPDIGAEPDLGRILGMTRGRFRRWFGGTAASWRGRQVLRRNAAVALGNSRDPRALPLLEEALGDPQPRLRAHAAWALGQLGEDLGDDPRATAAAALRARQADEADPEVLAEIAAALGRLATVSRQAGREAGREKGEASPPR